MPVIVVGADTEIGSAVVEALVAGGGEARAFVTEIGAAERLKALGAKVAIGDVSDAGHIAGAAYQTFCAILVDEAATDDRERSFAANHDEVIAAWAAALDEAHPQRAIWISPDPPPEKVLATTREHAIVNPEDGALGAVVEKILEYEAAGQLTD